MRIFTDLSGTHCSVHCLLIRQNSGHCGSRMRTSSMLDEHLTLREDPSSCLAHHVRIVVGVQKQAANAAAMAKLKP